MYITIILKLLCFPLDKVSDTLMCVKNTAKRIKTSIQHIEKYCNNNNSVWVGFFNVKALSTSWSEGKLFLIDIRLIVSKQRTQIVLISCFAKSC